MTTAAADTASTFVVRFYVPAEVVKDPGLLDQYLRLVWPVEERRWRRILSHGPAQPVTPWEWETAPVTEDLIAIIGSCEATHR